MSLKTAFSREVLYARTSLGLTQEQVAEAASISVRWYQYIESGTFLPSSVVTLRLILLLGIDVEIFREEAELVVPLSTR